MITDWSEPLGPGIRWVWWPVETMVRWNVFTGQQDLIGSEGKAVDDIRAGSEGLVRIKGKFWRATSSREIPYGQNLLVVGNDGLSLRVEAGPVLKSKEDLQTHVVLVPKEVWTAATVVGFEALLLVLGSGFWVTAFYATYLNPNPGYSMDRQDILVGALWHLSLAVGLTMIAAAWALPKLKNWARLMSLFLAGLIACGWLFVIVQAFITVSDEDVLLAFFGLPAILFQGWVFLCLFRPKVRQAFAEAKSFDLRTVEYVQE